MLHYDACPHVAQPGVDLFIDYACETLRHRLYSTNLSPPDFALFPKLKEPLRRTYFGCYMSFHWP